MTKIIKFPDINNLPKYIEVDDEYIARHKIYLKVFKHLLDTKETQTKTTS